MFSYCRNYDSGSDQNEIALLDGKTDFSSYYDDITEGRNGKFSFLDWINN